jgi:DNA-binding CsgD family transcriptional regulator
MTRTETVFRLLDEMNCGAALLDDAGCVLLINACAERILAKHATQDTETPPCNWSTNALRRLFGKAFVDTDIAIANGSRCGEARPLVGYRMLLDGATDRSRDHAIMVLLDLNERPAPSIAALRRTFGLTRAEAMLTAQLGMGKSLQEIALAQKVTMDTVRAQLRTVLAKTRTHRQAELVALVSRLTPLP